LKEIKDSIVPAHNQMAANFGIVTYKKIVDLHVYVKQKYKALRRAESKLDKTIKEGLFLEDVIASESSSEWKIKTVLRPTRVGCCGKLIDALGTFIHLFVNRKEWIWHNKIDRFFYSLVGIITIVLSVGVFLLEVLTFLNTKNSFMTLTVNTFIKTGSGFLKSQVIYCLNILYYKLMCLMPLIYISICVYSALFSVKVFSLYGLYPHHQTDTASLVFSAL